MFAQFGVIFDMDGVVVDSMPYHERAWKEFFRRHGYAFDRKTLRQHIYGKVNKEIISELFGRRMTCQALAALSKEKERLYRESFRAHAKPVKGLRRFMTSLEASGIPCALATSAPTENVRFVLKATKLELLFPVRVDASQSKRGKPHPEIFLKAAVALKVAPEHCVVFEDSLLGIEAAQRAGMKVIALTTTHPLKELRHADLVIKDFNELNVRWHQFNAIAQK